MGEFRKSGSNTNTKTEEKCEEEVSLSSKMREPLTYLSEMRNPPSPITIEIKKS